MITRPIQVRIASGWVMVGAVCEPDSTVWVEGGDLHIKDKYGKSTFPEGYWRYLPLTDDSPEGMK